MTYPIIVCGAARTGTRALNRLIMNHPDLCHRESEMPLTRQLLRFHERNADKPYFKTLAKGIDQHTAAHFFGDSGRSNWDALMRKWVLDTCPHHLAGQPWGGALHDLGERHFFDTWMALFPDSKIVHIVRDPRDVWASAKHSGWNRPWFRDLSIWAQAFNARNEIAALEHPNLIHLRYETLTVEAVFAALGYAPPENPAYFLGELAAKHSSHRKHQRDVPLPDAWQPNIGQWRSTLSPEEVAAIANHVPLMRQGARD